MNNLAIVKNSPALDALSLARDQMSAKRTEITDMNRERERLARLANEETAVLREIGEIGARELAVFKEWASGGRKGDAPELLTDERRAASERLARAQAVAAGAESAIGEIDAKIAQAHFEARELSAAVDEAIFAAMLARYAETFAICAKTFAAARLLAADCYGIRQGVYARAHELGREGKEALSLTFLQQLEHLKVPDTDGLGAPSNEEVIAAHALAANEIRRMMELGK